MIPAILLFCKNNWQILLVVALVIFAYSYGHRSGTLRERDKCNEVIQKIHDDAQATKDILQKQIDDLSADYQKNKDARETELKDIKKRYENAKFKKLTLACPADAIWLQLYKGTAASTASDSGS